MFLAHGIANTAQYCSPPALWQYSAHTLRLSRKG